MNIKNPLSLQKPAFSQDARKHLAATLILAALAASLFGRCLWSAEWMIGKPNTDAIWFWFPNYSVAQEEFNHWNLPGWNPYVFSGTPMLASFQPAILYPVHWLCALLLPMPLSANWMLFLHLFLAGAGVYAWGILRGLRPGGACVAGVAFMLSGPMLMHLYGSGYAHIMAMSWTPLVFLGIDGWLLRRRLRWVALASLSAAMQIYAGYPQQFYLTALLTGIYALTELFFAKKRLPAMLGLAAIWPLALALAMAQVLPGVCLSAESLRSGRLHFQETLVGMLGFEDLSVLFAPNITGGVDSAYWNNADLGTTMPYCGIAVLLLAVFAFCRMPWSRRWQWGVLLIAVLLLALGPNTSLHEFLFHHLPGYGKFRYIGRIVIFLPLFVALPAGSGFQRLQDGVKVPRKILLACAAAGLLSLSAGAWLYKSGPVGAYRSLARAAAERQIAIGHPSYLQNLDKSYVQRAGIESLQMDAQKTSAKALLTAGLLLSVCACFLWRAECVPWRRRLLALTVAADLLWMWQGWSPTSFPREQAEFPAMAEFLKTAPKDARSIFMFTGRENIRSIGGTLRAEGIWGFDALILKRYTEFIAASQGLNPDTADADMPLFRNSKLFQLLRGRYAFFLTDKGTQITPLHKDVPSRFLVAGNYRVMAGRDEILKTLDSPDFDFRREVILEKDPGLKMPAAMLTNPPSLVPVHKINVLSSSASRWEVEVETNAPGVLLMTDAYAKGWSARALPGSAQREYDLQPADWCVRGIPLTVGGTHRIEIKYTVPGLVSGAWTTFATLALLCLVGVWRHRRRFSRQQEGGVIP
jgi:hypothetical protein